MRHTTQVLLSEYWHVIKLHTKLILMVNKFGKYFEWHFLWGVWKTKTSKTRTKDQRPRKGRPKTLKTTVSPGDVQLSRVYFFGLLAKGSVFRNFSQGKVKIW